LFTVAEAADYLAVSLPTVKRLLALDDVPALVLSEALGDLGKITSLKAASPERVLAYP
jgi:hypothetical protein